MNIVEWPIIFSVLCYCRDNDLDPPRVFWPYYGVSAASPAAMDFVWKSVELTTLIVGYYPAPSGPRWTFSSDSGNVWTDYSFRLSAKEKAILKKKDA